MIGQDTSFPNQQMAQFWSEDFAQRMVRVLYKAHKEDKHYSNENENAHESYESYESDESDKSDEPSFQYLDDEE